MDNVLWACVVHEPDAKWLADHIAAVYNQAERPSCVLIIDTSNSANIRTIVDSKATPSTKYLELSENLGFNVGLNAAINAAIDGRHHWLATMTVRAKPDPTWLGELLDAGAPPRCGMITGLHLDEQSEGICYGHNLGTAGELFDFGDNISSSDLNEAIAQFSDPSLGIWGPCSGGALYRVAALKRAREIVAPADLIRRLGFKSYNCDAIAFSVRTAGFAHRLAPEAICYRDVTESTSKSPKPPGLLMNQEINRIANLFDFWPADLREAAIPEYLTQNRRTKLPPVDRRIARTLGEGLAKPSMFREVRRRVEHALRDHLRLYPMAKAVWKRLSKGPR